MDINAYPQMGAPFALPMDVNSSLRGELNLVYCTGFMWLILLCWGDLQPTTLNEPKSRVSPNSKFGQGDAHKEVAINRLGSEINQPLRIGCENLDY